MEKPNCKSPEEVAELYPRLLTERRFDEWAALFAEVALMVRVESGVPTSLQSVAAALPEQVEYGTENQRFAETWSGVSITTRGNLAIVTALYTLEVDHETRRGLDVLTLAGTDKGGGSPVSSMSNTSCCPLRRGFGPG